jgi:hypothetical protein
MDAAAAVDAKTAPTGIALRKCESGQITRQTEADRSLVNNIVTTRVVTTRVISQVVGRP